MLVGAFESEELCPGLHLNDTSAGAGDILHGDILIKLIGVGAHLKAENGAFGHRLAIAKHYILGVDALAAHSEDAVEGGTESAVLYENVLNYAVLNRLMGKNALSALDTYTVVVAIEIASAYYYIGAYIEVDCVAARSLDGLGRSLYVTILYENVAALVEVVGPES